MLTDLEERAVSDKAKRIEEGGAKALGLEMDITNLQAVRAVGERVKKEFGGVDFLVNNAGPIASCSSWKPAPIPGKRL